MRLGLGLGLTRQGTGTFTPQLNNLFLSTSTVAENVSSGTTVGALTNTQPGSSYSLIDNAGGRFALSGTNINTATLTDVAVDTAYNITVRETNGTYLNSPRDSVISITVTAFVVAPTLAALTLSDAAYVTGVSESGTIIGASSGSTITSGTLPTGFTIDGAARTWAWDGTGAVSTPSITLTETLAGATNTPNASVIGLAITAPSAGTTDGNIVVVAEGDSISIDNGLHYTSLYKASRPDISYTSLAVGGSDIELINDRLPTLLGMKPDLVSLFIGANGLTNYPSAQAYVDEIKLYVDQIRATGAKVVVCTNLPRFSSGDPTFTTLHNTRRNEIAVLLRAATWIDGIADFAADPTMGPDAAATDTLLYSDGLHPTNGFEVVSGEGGHIKLYRVYQPVMDALVADRALLPYPPSLVAPPTISGDAFEGGILYVDEGLDDPATTYARQWVSGTTAVPRTVISGETGVSYTAGAIGGQYVACRITPANGTPVRYSNAVRIHHATITAPVLLRTSTAGGSPFTYTVTYDSTVTADDIERVQYASDTGFTAILWDATRGLTEAAFNSPFLPDDSVDADPAWSTDPPTFTGQYYVRRKVISGETLNGVPVESGWSNTESNGAAASAVQISSGSSHASYTYSGDLLTFTNGSSFTQRLGTVDASRTGDRTAEMVINSMPTNYYLGIGFDDGTFNWAADVGPESNGWKGFIFYAVSNDTVTSYTANGTTFTYGPSSNAGTGFGGWAVGDIMRVRYSPSTNTAVCTRIRAGVETVGLTITELAAFDPAKLIFMSRITGASGTLKLTGLTPAINGSSAEYQ